jgi:hypothetical protein
MGVIEPVPAGCVTAQVTSWLELFFTAACNWTVAFACTIELALETLTEIGSGTGVGVPLPPQAATKSAISRGDNLSHFVDVLGLASFIIHPHASDDFPHNACTLAKCSLVPRATERDIQLAAISSGML